MQIIATKIIWMIEWNFLPEEISAFFENEAKKCCCDWRCVVMELPTYCGVSSESNALSVGRAHYSLE